MTFRETAVGGAFIIEIDKLSDERGFFARTFCEKEFRGAGLDPRIVQTNIAFSIRKNTVRGMHYQAEPMGEVKIVQCTRGAIYDVVIDLRPDSATFGQWAAVELTQDNYTMLYIPRGCAHGYQTLTANAQVSYLVSQFYAKESERGVRWNDPFFRIHWPETNDIVISEKDAHWPLFPAAKNGRNV